MKQFMNNIRIISFLFFALFIFSGCDKTEVTTDNQPSPITVKAPRPGFATFTNSNHPDNTIGYRFLNIPHLFLDLNQKIIKQPTWIQPRFRKWKNPLPKDRES